MRVLVIAGVLLLGGCGSAPTTNYSAPPPEATIVATPTPIATPTPEAPVGPSDTPIGDDNIQTAAGEAVANGM